MASLDGLFGGSAANAAPAAPASSSLDTLFGNAPVAVKQASAATLVPSSAVKTAATSVAQSVPPPVTPPSFLGKVGSFISNISNSVGNAVLGPDENDNTSEDAIGKETPLNRTLSFLPSSIAANLPFGIGNVFSAIQNDPAAAGGMTLKDTVDSVPSAVGSTALSLARGIASVPTSLAGAAETLATGGRLDGNISVNVPGLGKIDNAQMQVANKINGGEDPVQAALEVGSDSIFNTLFFADLASAPFRAGTAKVAEFKGDVPTGPVDGAGKPITQTPGASSFRLYETPHTSQPLPQQALAQMEAQGVDFGKNFDPKAPTFFRVSQTAKGNILGEVIQIKPSVFESLMSKFKSDATAEGYGEDHVTMDNTPALQEAVSQLPSGDVTSLHSQEVDPKAATEAVKNAHLEVTAVSPEDAHNIDEARTRLEAGTSPADVTKELSATVGDTRAQAIVQHAQTNGMPKSVNPAPMTPERATEAVKQAQATIEERNATEASKEITPTVHDLLAPSEPVSHETSAIEHHTNENAPSYNSPTGTYFAPKGAGDSGFGSNKFDMHIKPEANIITPGSSLDVMEKRGLMDTEDKKLAQKYGPENNTLRKLDDNASSLDNPNDTYLERQIRAIKILKRENPNADIVKFTGEDDLNPTQYVVLNKDAVSEKPAEVPRETPAKAAAEATPEENKSSLPAKLVENAGELQDQLMNDPDEYDPELEESVISGLEEAGYTYEASDMQGDIRVSVNTRDIHEAQTKMVDLVKAFHPDITLKTNADGTITLYHGTSEEATKAIIKDGFDGPAFLSSGTEELIGGVNGASYYGEHILSVRADPRDIQFSLTGEFLADDSDKLAGVKAHMQGPKTPEEAAQLYYDAKIKPAIEAKKAIVIGADDMKDFFGEDYDDTNHPIYSRGAFLLYERALEESPSDRVIFTAGGAGSGKTEILTKEILKSGYDGIIYDSNMANQEGIEKQTAMARAEDKHIEIYLVTPDLNRARGFTIMRANETGRAISDKTFARGHAGAPRVALKLLEDGTITPQEIHIVDTRDITDIDIARNLVAGGTYASDPLAYLKEIQYDEEHVQRQFTKENYSESGTRLADKELPEIPGFAPAEDRTDRTSEESPEAYAGEKELTSNVLEKLKGRTTVSKQFIENLIKTPNLRSSERAVVQKILDGEPNTIPVKAFADRVAAELLPLSVDTKQIDYTEDLPETNDFHDAPETQYETINLPSDLRGDVSLYKEKVYESPIENGAGDVHFDGKEYPSYFAHTRIEDMKDGTTRRVLEAQSDLFQRGRLEENSPQKRLDMMKQNMKDSGITPDPESMKSWEGRIKEYDRLSPYKNTWQERIVDEEVKAAAKAGKTILQFPTGETAMKVEGLVNQDNGGWMYGAAEDIAMHDNLDMHNLTKDSVGEIVNKGHQDWVITDILGEGKFKAVPKETYDRINGTVTSNKPGGFTAEQAQAQLEGVKEAFDISGEVDTKSPIYKFYESELAKYLKKQYGATPVTDDKGVTWNEINVPAAKAEDPIYAFGRSQEMMKPTAKPKAPKPVTRPEPMRGFINPVVIAEDVANAAKGVKTFIDKTQTSIELSDDVALNLYKLQGANQVDLEEVSKLAKKINKVDAADNEALYHHAEQGLNPRATPIELTPRQQELYEKYDKPLADANRALTDKIKKAGYGITGEGYIHRVLKGMKSPVDTLLSPQEKEEAKLALGGLLKKSSTSFKSRNMQVLEDAEGNRRVVSIKNAEYTIDKGKREGDTIRSKRVTGFDEGKKPVDLGSFKLKTNEQLRDSEIRPIQKKIENVQKKIDGLDMLRMREPVSKGRIEGLENEITSLAELLDYEFSSGAYTAKEMKPYIRMIRAREDEIRTLKTVSPAERLNNQADRIAKLQDDIRKMSNDISAIEAGYVPENLDQKVFTDKTGKEWKISQATSLEIEDQTNIEYHHNALASRIVQYLELNRISRAIDFIENFKTDPRFSELAIEDAGQNQPEGYKRTMMPQFRTYWVENRTADVMDNFFNYTRPSEGLLEQGLDAVGHFLVNSIFYNPIAHPLNVTNLWLADRGGTLLAPGRYKAAVTAFAKAFTAVTQKNDDYTYALLHGAPIMNTATNREDLAKQLYDTLASEIDKSPEQSKPLSIALGFKTVMDMKKAFSKAWHGATWIPNDILTLQAIYERQATKGMSFEDAVQETARFIPDYRMPSRILGSRKVSETFQDRGLLGSVWFAMAYHYGEVHSIAAIARDIVAPKGGPDGDGAFSKEGTKERADAIGKALMLAFLAVVVYSALDKIWQEITGNANTYVSRSGSVKLVADAMQIAESQADYTKILQAELALNPAYEGAAEMLFNTDFYTRNPIVGQPPAEGLLTFAESIFAPASAASRMSPEDFALSLLNVHTPKNSPGQSALDAQLYDELPETRKTVEKDIAAGDKTGAKATMDDFNQRLATNYQQSLIQAKLPPATPAQVAAYVKKNGIKTPGAVAQANADKLYADNQTAGKQNLLDTVVTYAHALGVDPATAFERIFTGQTITSVTKDNVIITARMSLAQSEALRQVAAKDQNVSASQLAGMQLDHVIPIAAGGSNDRSNLSLISTAQNQYGEQHQVEDFLASAVKQGEISSSMIKEISIRYKAGKGEMLSPAYQDAYKTKYGSQPITAQQIYDLVNSGKAK